VVQHCNGRTYDNAYLITFKSRTLARTHTLAPSILQLLEAPAEGFFWNLPELSRRIECDDRTPEDSKRSFPPVLPTIAGSMEQVCVRARVLLWRWLGKRSHMSYNYSAIPQFRKIFDCHSYVHTCLQETNTLREGFKICDLKLNISELKLVWNNWDGDAIKDFDYFTHFSINCRIYMIL